MRLGAGLGVNVLLMRGLGVEGYGVYGYVLTLVGLCSFGASLGMERLLKREIARHPEKLARLVATGLATTACLAVLTACVIVGAAWGLDGRSEVVLAATLGAVALGLQACMQVVESAFHGLRTMKPAVRAQIAGKLTLLVVTAALIWGGAGVAAVFGAQILDAAIALGGMGWLARKRLDLSGFGTSPSEMKGLAREAVPFGLNLLFGSIYLSVDVLLLAQLKGDADVGIYRGAVMLITLFPVIANTLTTGLYPKMARHLGDPVAAGAELRFASRVLLAISVPAAVGGILVAEDLMVFVGGEAFAVSAASFMVLAPLLPLRFLNNATAMTLSSLNRQAARTRGVAVAAVVNLVANLLVIPTWGAVGAAATTLGTEVVLTFWFRWHARGLVQDVDLLPSIARVCVPAAIMGAVVWVFPPVHVLVTIAAGAAVYAVVGLGTKAWHPSDLRELRRV